MHFAPAKKALESGFHVVSDKPMTLTLEEAKELKTIVYKSGLIFALTHNYTGYPMVKQARGMVATGELGDIKKVVVEYPQGWLATKLEESEQKQAAWRTDPARAGKSCCMGDIGTHAENLAEYITDLKISEMCAEFTTFVEGRPLEDDGNVLLRFSNGAKGILYASQISVGEENGLNIRVYGTKGSLEWHQMEPNNLIAKWGDRPKEILRPGVDKPLLPGALAACRLPSGHPEAFLEAFANIYHKVARCIQARLAGTEPSEHDLDFPTVDDGVRGMAFIETVVASANSNVNGRNLSSSAYYLEPQKTHKTKNIFSRCLWIFT